MKTQKEKCFYDFACHCLLLPLLKWANNRRADCDNDRQESSDFMLPDPNSYFFLSLSPYYRINSYSPFNV